MEKEKTAVLIKNNLEGFTGHASLYRVTPPVEFNAGRDDEQEEGLLATTDFIVVSAIIASYTGAETYLFPADETGEILDWSELRGSMRGTLSHEEALENAGYSILEEGE